MNDQENVETTNPTPTPDPVQAERERVRAIQAVCVGPLNGAENRDIEARAISEGWSLDTVRAALLERLLASRPTISAIARPGAFAGDRPTDTKQFIAASALLMANHPEAAAKHFGERTVQSIRRPHNWYELCASALQASGQSVPHDRPEMLKAAFSTTSLPNALGLGVQKLALDVFLEMSAAWRNVSRIVSATSFREGKAIRLSPSNRLQKIGPGGEITHGTINEEPHTFRIDTYARMFGITRQDIINDDLSILDDLPRALGAESARTVSDLFFDTLTGPDAASFFTNPRGNLLTGSLGITEISQAVEAIRTMTDSDGRVLGLEPRTLLVPAALEFTARACVESLTLARDLSTDLQPVANPLQSLRLTVAVEPRLDADDPTAWYVFAAPVNAAVLVAFLNGMQGVTVESSDAPFDRLGMQWRAYMDVGVSLAEYRAAIKSVPGS